MSGARSDSDSLALLNPAAPGLQRLDNMPLSIAASPIACSATALSFRSRIDHSAWDHFADSEAVRAVRYRRGPFHPDEMDSPRWYTDPLKKRKSSRHCAEKAATRRFCVLLTICLGSENSSTRLRTPRAVIAFNLGIVWGDPLFTSATIYQWPIFLNRGGNHDGASGPIHR